MFFAVFGGAAYFYNNQEKLSSLTSPVSKVYGISQKKVIVNDWFPDDKGLQKGYDNLNLTAKSAILVNFEAGEVIFAKDPKRRQPVASTVKIMTALVGLNHAILSEEFTVSKKAAEVGEDSMYLSEGEKLSFSDLMFGMMLNSGNDAAITIAENTYGSEEGFVSQMNKQAEGLGLKDSKFINVSGLDEDGKSQYSTAYDLAVIAHYLWFKHPEVEDFTSTYQKYIEETAFHKAYDLYNQTNLLTTYPGVRGIKPGFTWEAGYCLVTYVENDGKKLLGVILGSENRRIEMKELLDYGFGYYGIRVDHPALDY